MSLRRDLPADFEPGEKIVTVTSDKGSGHGYFRLGKSKELWPRLVLPGSTLSGTGDYEISDAALKEYADFYQGTVRDIIGMDGYIYAFTEMLNGGTAVLRYQIQKKTWEKVCTSTEYSPSSGAAAWNGKILITGQDPRGNKAAIGVLDPTTMKLTKCDAGDVRVKGKNLCVCTAEDGTIYAFPGNKLSFPEQLIGSKVTYDGAVPSIATKMDLSGLFEGMTTETDSCCNGVMTKDGFLMFSPLYTDETGSVVADSFLVSTDGKKMTRQSKLLSYRPTQLIVTTAYDGVCYVMGASIYETKDCFFAGIKTDVVEPYGEKAYSNEWVDGIWYGKNGFRTKSHPYKAQWKSNKKGSWYQDRSGWYPANCWQKIDGEWYYFDKDGYMEKDTFRNGWYLGKDGAYDGKAQAQWKQNSRGWWFGDTSGWYAKNRAYVIDGTSYKFNSAGYCTNP